MKKHYKIIDLFAGIGGIRLGFEEYGCKCVFTSEWDKYAQQTYQANFGDLPAGDITKIEPKDIPDHDILLGGFPCQPFSIIGERKGFADTRGTLFFYIEKILEVKKPIAFMLENVKQLTSHDGGRTFKTIIEHLKALGYHVYHSVLNALDFGVPQKRERIFIVGFKKRWEFNFPKPTHKRPHLDTLLEKDEDIPKSFFVSEELKQDRFQRIKTKPNFPSIWHENKGGNISALPYSCALRANASHNYLLVNGTRRLTPRELMRLQGFPDTFEIVVSYAQIKKQTGNSVAVPVIKAVAKEIIKTLNERKMVEPTLIQTNLFED
ncbi:MAG: DNA cytosine methyltransferase [Candidatus Wallbacteria bacterium]